MRFILVAHFSIKTVSLICLVASTLAKAVLATPHCFPDELIISAVFVLIMADLE